MNLSAIVIDICMRAGIAEADIDTSELTDEVIGYQIPRQMPARTALETLMAAYNFDAAEIDWKLVFKKRGAASSVTVSQADLRAHPAGEAAPDLAVETRTQDIELPTHLALSYESKLRDYEIATQRAVRVDKSAQVMRTAQLGLVMTDAHAKQQAEILLKRLWTGRHRYSFSVGYEYLGVAPADVITVMGKDMRVVEIHDRGGVLDITAESEESGVYESSAEADDLTIDADDLASESYVPDIILMDLPPIDEDTGQAGLYVALYGPPDSFAGGVVERSIDGGASYQPVASIGTTSATVGDCTSTLGDGIEGIIDYTSSLTVDLADCEGTLSSATDAQLWGGANLAAVGSSSGWEIIQFKTATAGPGYTYTLTGLLRGLYGTRRFMAAHASGEKFVLLTNMTGIDFAGGAVSDIGIAYRYRVRNAYNSVGDPVTATTGGLGLYPYEAQGVFASRNSSDDCILSWRRGDRYEFTQDDFPNGGDIDMSETSESYSVDVIHPSTYAVVRTLTASSPSVTYTAAQRTTDSYPSGPITFDIYQVSSVVGRGIVRRVTV